MTAYGCATAEHTNQPGEPTMNHREQANFTPKHLQILRYFKSAQADGVRDYIGLKNCEKECRIDSQRLAIHTELLQLAATGFLAFHPKSTKHFKITAKGLEACQTLDIGEATIGGKVRRVVVDAATKRPPKAISLDPDDIPVPDDDEDEPPSDNGDDSTDEDTVGDAQEQDREVHREDLTETVGQEDPEIGQEIVPPPPPKNKPKGPKKPPTLPAPVRPIGKPASQTPKRTSLPKK